MLPRKLLHLLVNVGLCLAYAPSPDYSVGWRTLVLSSDEYQSALPLHVCNAYGGDCDFKQLTKTEVLYYNNDDDLCIHNTALPFQVDFVDANGLPKYNSIVLTHSTLGFSTCVPDGKGGYEAFFNATGVLSKEQWDKLNQYRTIYRVRTVVLQSTPGPEVDPALARAVSGQFGFPVQKAVLKMDQNVAKGFHGSVPVDANIQAGKETEFIFNEYFIEPAILADPSANHIQPFLSVVSLEPVPSTPLPKGTFVGFLRTDPRGWEEMHFLINANMFGLHGFVFADMWYPWLYRGLFVGQRRVLLDTQIDDYYLDTGTYNITEDRQALDDENTPPLTYRITATDLELLKNFQSSIRSEWMPAGSNFTIQMAINARGATEFSKETDYPPNVNEASVLHRDEFLWVSHTWNHIDLYCIESHCDLETFTDAQLKNCSEYTAETDCHFAFNNDRNGFEPFYPPGGFTPYEYAIYEITRNQKHANMTLFATVDEISADGTKTTRPMTDEERESWKTWSAHSIVTPRISGLNYTESIRAMLHAGIYTAVGDNSRRDLKPTNIFHGFNARALAGPNGGPVPANFNDEMIKLYGRESVFVIPRFATRVYFDVSLPEELAKEHNSFYGPRCQGWNSTGPVYPGGNKCNVSSYQYDRDLTAQEIMQIEGFETARNILSHRTDPYMFHQGNLRFFDWISPDGQKHKASLLSLWIEAAMHWVLKYSTLPVLTYKMDDLEKFYRQRESRDDCKVRAVIRYLDNVPAYVDIYSASLKSCAAKISLVTNIDGAKNFVLKSAGVGRPAPEKEEYGPDETYDVTLEPCEVKRYRFPTTPSGKAEPPVYVVPGCDSVTPTPTQTTTSETSTIAETSIEWTLFPTKTGYPTKTTKPTFTFTGSNTPNPTFTGNPEGLNGTEVFVGAGGALDQDVYLVTGFVYFAIMGIIGCVMFVCYQFCIPLDRKVRYRKMEDFP